MTAIGGGKFLSALAAPRHGWGRWPILGRTPSCNRNVLSGKSQGGAREAELHEKLLAYAEHNVGNPQGPAG